MALFVACDRPLTIPGTSVVPALGYLADPAFCRERGLRALLLDCLLAALDRAG